MEKEIWKPVKGYEGGYEVSNLGRVRTCEGRCNGRKPIREGILCLGVSNDGYIRVRLSMDGHTKCCLVHRLVAEAFIPNPNNLPQVNHKDENKSNNHVENLEWCTRNYNVNYGECIAKIKKNQPHKKGVCQYDKDFVLIAEFQSLHEAGKINGIIWQCIRDCCCGRQNTAYGYIWKFKNKE